VSLQERFIKTKCNALNLVKIFLRTEGQIKVRAAHFHRSQLDHQIIIPYLLLLAILLRCLPIPSVPNLSAMPPAVLPPSTQYAKRNPTQLRLMYRMRNLLTQTGWLV